MHHGCCGAKHHILERASGLRKNATHLDSKETRFEAGAAVFFAASSATGEAALAAPFPATILLKYSSVLLLVRLVNVADDVKCADASDPRDAADASALPRYSSTSVIADCCRSVVGSSSYGENVVKRSITRKNEDFDCWILVLE